MFVSRKMLQHASQGGGQGWGARMRKMCLHGPWEIPPLPPRMRPRSGGESSHCLITGRVQRSEGELHLDLGGGGGGAEPFDRWGHNGF